ncbi:ImmA/IrrE family metallo-endopeptidase, partial [Staphylococcus simulans]|uniref:ImmA/IrrE family metallo-endopeptidase n=1 Tax=Staphylococcus simulans TaxID=1286 RepID=UPI000D49057E
NIEIDELQDINDIEVLSKKLREIINVKDNPIEDMLELLELLGIIVVKFSYDESKVDAFSCTAKLNGENYFAVVTGNTRSFYRQQFSLAHELGHWLLHKDYVPSELEKDEYKLMEREANEFAAAFLLPKDGILKDFKNIGIDLNSLLQLKKKWKVSIAALIERAFQLNVIKAEDRSNLYRRMNYHKWKVVEPLDRETPVTEPLALAQAIELLIDENVMNGYTIRREIQKKYNLFITKSMMAEVCNVDESVFESENKLNLNINTNFISENNHVDND